MVEFESDQMKSNDLQAMSLDELWNLHELVVAELNSQNHGRAGHARKSAASAQFEREWSVKARATSLPQSPTKISESKKSRRDLGWSRQAATLANCSASIWKKTERVFDPREIPLIIANSKTSLGISGV